ncbi:hydroxylase [Kitasatospora phosalacinea]|uniref:Hydroxylase n=1 Tax=Kitasatospora phosalacinea TaxID=2065 RepID=A0A9W6Q695_9ACTN|nr:VOC family protein [Kitasatospora phosalacinea]GLW70687.1 hydroxylase [Kitasatospora phosalacinea]
MVSSDFRPGSPNWIGLGSADLAESELFYGSLFGWELGPPGPNGYGLFRSAGRTVAGVGPLTEAEPLPAWTVHFAAADAARVAAAAERSGGAVRVGPTEVPGQGRFVQLTDPTGGRFAVWEAGGTAGLEVVGERGALCRAELHTSDLPGALRFYRGLFGWRSRDSDVPGVEYAVLRPADGEEEFGGLTGVHPRVDVGWLVHFAVADALLATDEVRRLGGSVLVPPEQVPTVGRIAVLADPFGAQFALLEPEPRRP